MDTALIRSDPDTYRPHLLANIFTEPSAAAPSLHAMPLLLGVLCVLAIAYRYYSAFLAAKVAALDDPRTTPAHRYNDGQNYRSDQQVGAVRPSLRRHLRGRAADRSGAGDPVRLHAGSALAGDRRLPGRGGAGHARAGGLGAPRRQVAGRDRPHRAGPCRPASSSRRPSCSSSSSPWPGWASSWSRRSAARRSSWPKGMRDHAARRQTAAERRFA